MKSYPCPYNEHVGDKFYERTIKFMFISNKYVKSKKK